MTAPTYWRQTGGLHTVAARDAWASASAHDARAKGMKHVRLSYDERNDLLLMEGWAERPDEWPEPSFAFVEGGG